MKDGEKMTNDINKKEIQYTCSPILVPISTGLLSGAASVIGAYIFKPIWNKIKSLWEPKQTTIIQKEKD